MKILIVMMGLLISTNLQAMPVMLDWTGLKSEKFDRGFYIGHTAPGFIGGSVANNSLGGAWQFSVAAKTKIDYIKASGKVVNQFEPDSDLDVYFKVYDQTRRHEYWGITPEVNSAIYTSAPFHVDGNLNFINEQTLDFEVELEPGVYWFAQERGFSDGGPIVIPRVEFYANDEFHAVHAPEPTTMALMGTGLIGWLIKRRGKMMGLILAIGIMVASGSAMADSCTQSVRKTFDSTKDLAKAIKCIDTKNFKVDCAESGTIYLSSYDSRSREYMSCDLTYEQDCDKPVDTECEAECEKTGELNTEGESVAKDKKKGKKWFQ